MTAAKWIQRGNWVVILWSLWSLFKPTLPPSINHSSLLKSLNRLPPACLTTLRRAQFLCLAGYLCKDAYLWNVLIPLTAEPYHKSLGYDHNEFVCNWKEWVGFLFVVFFKTHTCDLQKLLNRLFQKSPQKQKTQEPPHTHTKKKKNKMWGTW